MALVPIHRRHRNGLSRIHGDIDDLFNSFFRGLDSPFSEHKVWPAIDVIDEENEVVVRVEVPGCKAEDIDISVHGHTLTISGEKKQEEQTKEKGYCHVERSYGSFRRDLNLGTEVDTGKIEAICKEGVLTITLPKAEKAKAIKIKVKG